ncbi:PREDICTED: MRG/MORF4L-binding protein [Dipodomys ordii]|nr:PREDICTED: MRG/MORF4L-binding protein [Dipodomys ordii]
MRAASEARGSHPLLLDRRGSWGAPTIQSPPLPLLHWGPGNPCARGSRLCGWKLYSLYEGQVSGSPGRSPGPSPGRSSLRILAPRQGCYRPAAHQLASHWQATVRVPRQRLHHEPAAMPGPTATSGTARQPLCVIFFVGGLWGSPEDGRTESQTGGHGLPSPTAGTIGSTQASDLQFFLIQRNGSESILLPIPPDAIQAEAEETPPPLPASLAPSHFSHPLDPASCFPPAGVNRHFHMICIRDKFSQNIGRQVPSKVIWDHLSTMYDMQALHESEILPFPNPERNFVLPEEIIQEVREGKVLIEEEVKEEMKEDVDPHSGADDVFSSSGSLGKALEKSSKDKEKNSSDLGCKEGADKRKRSRVTDKVLTANSNPSSPSAAKRRRT